MTRYAEKEDWLGNHGRGVAPFTDRGLPGPSRPRTVARLHVEAQHLQLDYGNPMGSTFIYLGLYYMFFKKLTAGIKRLFGSFINNHYIM